jgi:hypothetical protein
MIASLMGKMEVVALLLEQEAIIDLENKVIFCFTAPHPDSFNRIGGQHSNVLPTRATQIFSPYYFDMGQIKI